MGIEQTKDNLEWIPFFVLRLGMKVERVFSPNEKFIGQFYILFS